MKLRRCTSYAGIGGRENCSKSSSQEVRPTGEKGYKEDAGDKGASTVRHTGQGEPILLVLASLHPSGQREHPHFRDRALRPEEGLALP